MSYRQHRLCQMSPHEVSGMVSHTVRMDIVLSLPLCRPGYIDTCTVSVDLFSKTVMLRPMSSCSIAHECCTVFCYPLICRCFLPVKLNTDWDPHWVSQMWDELMDHLRIEWKLISTYQQQADPAERYIKTIQTLLQLYIMGDDWIDCLRFIELILNKTRNS